MSSDSPKALKPSLVSGSPASPGEQSITRAGGPLVQRDLSYLVLALIVLLAAALRLYRLGAQSFWFDEVCQVLVAISPTIKQVFVGLRQQIAAMPLDFVVVWLFAHIGTQEAILRLPAVIWGVLSILISYRLFSRLTGKRTALFAVLLLALSPFHIRYSQEVRYYSSLVFFYLAATDCLFSAIQNPSRRRWILFVLVALIGTYFHPFVQLCFINGLAWLLFRGNFSANLKSRWIPLLISGCVTAFAFITTYLSFIAKTSPISMEHFELFMAYSLVVGLGWIPLAYVVPGLGWIWGIFNLVFGLVGFSLSLRSSNSNLKAITVSVFTQIVLLVAAEYFLYFPEPRQFIEILPLMLLLSAVGASGFLHRLKQTPDQASTGIQGTTPNITRLLGYGLVGLWIVSSIPALSDYYRSDRSRALLISQNLAASWSPGDTILVMPDTIFGHEGIVYNYYLKNILGYDEIAASIQGTDWKRLENDSRIPTKIYLVTTSPGPSPYLSLEHQAALIKLGYRPLPLSEADDTHLQRLWVRE
jgi:uncharacterized membrane protein